MFIGRFQPWHAGHEWLIDQKLQQGVPCVVAVRDCEHDYQNGNPIPVSQVVRTIEMWFYDACGCGEMSNAAANSKVIIIPDIESFNYGRDVGYEVNEWTPPPNIADISATKIRMTL